MNEWMTETVSDSPTVSDTSDTDVRLTNVTTLRTDEVSAHR